jgi:hypothetical protein
MMDAVTRTLWDDFTLWEDELIMAELEAGLCPWIFGSGLVTS